MPEDQFLVVESVARSHLSLCLSSREQVFLPVQVPWCLTGDTQVKETHPSSRTRTCVTLRTQSAFLFNKLFPLFQSVSSSSTEPNSMFWMRSTRWRILCGRLVAQTPYFFIYELVFIFECDKLSPIGRKVSRLHSRFLTFDTAIISLMRTQGNLSQRPNISCFSPGGGIALYFHLSLLSAEVTMDALLGDVEK